MKVAPLAVEGNPAQFRSYTDRRFSPNSMTFGESIPQGWHNPSTAAELGLLKALPFYILRMPETMSTVKVLH